MKGSDLEKEVKKKAVRGKISCSNARMVAESLGVSYKTVGKAADRLNIKIITCQLGCF
ncbi:MAG: hypothetical protein HY755_03580 [Nitrospirae bacterium]|nr:hypothetical protein [Nitrospirota bacterium]